jgi:hypothetical protein
MLRGVGEDQERKDCVSGNVTGHEAPDVSVYFARHRLGEQRWGMSEDRKANEGMSGR